MTADDETQLKTEFDALRARFEAVSMRNADLERKLVDSERRIGELAAGVEQLKSQMENAVVDNEDDDSIAKEMGDVSSAAKRIEDPQVVIPDAQVWKGQSKRKSVKWAKEMANILELNEFDDAPDTGCIKVIKRGKMFVLVDPDENTGGRKWMIPVRREDGGKELKWLRIGKDDSASESQSGSGGDESSSGPCDPDIVVEEVAASTAHPNGGCKITVTHADCSQNEYYIWNGSDGADCSASGGGSSMSCCEVRQCLAGLPAPHAISYSNETVTIQPRKYKVSSGSDCIEMENDGNAVSFTIPTLPTHTPVTVLTGWEVSGTSIIVKSRQVSVVDPGSEQTATIRGRDCESAVEGGD